MLLLFAHKEICDRNDSWVKSSEIFGVCDFKISITPNLRFDLPGVHRVRLQRKSREAFPWRRVEVRRTQGDSFTQSVVD